MHPQWIWQCGDEIYKNWRQFVSLLSLVWNKKKLRVKGMGETKVFKKIFTILRPHLISMPRFSSSLFLWPFILRRKSEAWFLDWPFVFLVVFSHIYTIGMSKPKQRVHVFLIRSSKHWKYITHIISPRNRFGVSPGVFCTSVCKLKVAFCTQFEVCIIFCTCEGVHRGEVTRRLYFETIDFFTYP